MVTIPPELLRGAIDAELDSGVMDYSDIESSYPDVKISPLSKAGVARVIECRTNAWRALLKGEDQRWESIDDLIDFYRRSQNHMFNIPVDPTPPSSIVGMWTESGKEHRYHVTLTKA